MYERPPDHMGRFLQAWVTFSRPTTFGILYRFAGAPAGGAPGAAPRRAQGGPGTDLGSEILKFSKLRAWFLRVDGAVHNHSGRSETPETDAHAPLDGFAQHYRYIPLTHHLTQISKFRSPDLPRARLGPACGPLRALHQQAARRICTEFRKL